MDNVLASINTVMDYDGFCRVAKDLDWIDVNVQHEDWYHTYSHHYPLGICLDLFTFPVEYIQNHLPEAYVRAVLSGMAIYEEWDADFWDIPKSQRIDCLTQGRRLYESYAIPREVRLILRDWQYLTGEMGFFADSNKVPAVKQREILDRFNNAMVIEIGGDYSGDYQYLAVQEDLLMMVSCGIWD
ncbi:MAG: hypothetical protein K2G55_08935 [Lachnospiraceae bacterium]|nr:hypothetical protein [Lachnospiraceae bacterium]MDE7201851.1 hypothetical protein [Lachnospiraceae bacterium]